MEAADSGDGPWKPTGGTIPALDLVLNNGLHNGQPIYIHNTSAEGYAGILKSQMLGSTPDHTRRGVAAKSGVYLCISTQTFSPGAAHTLLFFEEDKYALSSTHCIIFSPKGALAVATDPVSHGSWVKETIYRGNIKFADIHLIYSGPNPFASLTKQNHYMKAYDIEG